MTWAHYLLQVNIYLVIFYAFYRLLLDKETYFMLNRIYLIAAGTLSLAIPFMKQEWFLGAEAPHTFRVSVDQLNQMMANVTVATDQNEQFSWPQLITVIYAAGILFFTVRLVLRLLAVRKRINNQKDGMAFSFFRMKVIDDSLPEQETINRHEDIHIRQLHTIDVLFFEVLGILVWCNPVIYLYKSTVKNIHEYLADEEAAIFQGDKESYAMLLLSKAFGIDQNVLTNSFFNKSLLKKRIYMLHKQRSKKIAIYKYGLFLPLFATILLLSSATISRNERIKAVANKIAAPISLDVIPSLVDLGEKGETQTANPGKNVDSWTPFYNYLSRSIRYPARAISSKVQGNTIIKFSIYNGEVSGLAVVSPIGMGCDAMVMKNILTYENFGKIKNGDYSIKVAFRLAEAGGQITNAAVTYPKGYTPLREITVNGSASAKLRVTATAKTGKNADHSTTTNEKVFDFVSIDTQPGFPGGMEKFYAYLGSSCKYPAEAIKNNIQGKVFLSFIIETDGQLTAIKVERPLGYGTDEEAVRVLKASPKWIPAIKNGETVRVKYNMPISFTLDKKVSITEKAPDHTTTTMKGSEPILIKPMHPLYVIDGVKMTNGNFNSIDPSDIVSISILKDAASTATYGDEGKGGVVLVTTKNTKPQLK